MTNQLQHQQRRAVDLRIPAIEKYAYCLCLHVKPTTIFIAVFKLIRALLFASILLNAEFSVNEQVNDLGSSLDDRHKSTAAAVYILTRIVMASVAAVGIYAVISGRAALLMPLYAILLVDFFFALPAFYNRDLDPSLTDGMTDFSRSYGPGNNQYTRYSLMLFSTIVMIVKIYFLCVIWKCYRYLRLIELVSPIRLAEMVYPHIHQGGGQYPIVRVLSSGDSTDLGSGHNVAPPPYETIASSMKPPNYEDAIKTSAMTFPPNLVSDNQQQSAISTNLNSAHGQGLAVGDSSPVEVVQANMGNDPPVFVRFVRDDDTTSRSPTVTLDVTDSGNQVMSRGQSNIELNQSVNTVDSPILNSSGVETHVSIPTVESVQNSDTN